MEVYSLLKYWRGNGGGGGPTNSIGANIRTPTPATVRQIVLQTEEDEDDEGSLFELEFTVSEDEHNNEETDSEDDEEGDSESPGSSFCMRTESSSTGFKFNPSEPKFPASIFKSATKFRVFMLRFKKPNSSTNTETNDPKQPDMKFNVEEIPIVSLFNKDNSSSSRRSGNKIKKKQSSEEEKKFAKEVVQKCLKKIKPLYVRVSKRYGEKLRFSSQLISSIRISSSKMKNKIAEADQSERRRSISNCKSQKQGNLQGGLRVVCKNLRKSRSASSGVEAVSMEVRRRDDSLLEQQDGIQSAILHCKRSFSGSRDSDSSLLTRSMSDPSYEKSRNSSGES